MKEKISKSSERSWNWEEWRILTMKGTLLRRKVNANAHKLLDKAMTNRWMIVEKEQKQQMEKRKKLLLLWRTDSSEGKWRLIFLWFWLFSPLEQRSKFPFFWGCEDGLRKWRYILMFSSSILMEESKSSMVVWKKKFGELFFWKEWIGQQLKKY